MAKVTMSKLYNKGRREWPFDIGSGDKKKTITCKPGRSVELTTARAEKMVSLYPGDFILGDKMASSSSSKDVKKLTAENAALKDNLESAKVGLEKLDEVEKENAALKEELEALKANQAPVSAETKTDPEK